jgi:hypothetical protein
MFDGWICGESITGQLYTSGLWMIAETENASSLRKQ